MRSIDSAEGFELDCAAPGAGPFRALRITRLHLRGAQADLVLYIEKRERLMTPAAC